MRSSANEALVCPPERDRLGGPPELAREGREREWRVLFAHGLEVRINSKGT